MSRAFASPLGDLSVSRLTPKHWGAAVAVAVLAHALGGWAFWAFAPEPAPAEVEETAIGVALGPPGGRLEQPPPASTPAPQAAPSEPQALSERAADAPPVAFTPPLPPAPPGAALSSGIGSGGSGAPAPPPPPPPPAPVAARLAMDPGLARAYARNAAALIHEEIIYPERALEDQAEGSAVLVLTIQRNGELVDSAMTRSSGDAALDAAIMNGVQAVRRFPPLPESYPSNTFVLNLTIRFQLIRD